MTRTWPWALTLLVLSPVCAEYLWGYDDSTGDPVALVGGLLIFVPLYGAPALLIREAARRLGLGWTGVLLLATAAGLVQAGLVDQSMFSTSYRDIPYWDDITEPTAVPGLGLSVYTTLTFVGGHVVLSFTAPIALVEGVAGRAREHTWVGRRGLVAVALLYLAACALVLGDHLSSENDHASLPQAVGTAAVVLALVAAAVPLGRANRGDPASATTAGAVSPWWVTAGAVVAASSYTVLPPSRLGTAGIAVVALSVVLVVRTVRRRRGWGPNQAAALAGGALVAAGLGAFRTDPLGDVPQAAQLAHNLTLLALVAGWTALAVRRSSERATR